MPLTPRQLIVLLALRRYWYLLAAQLRDLIAIAEQRSIWDQDGGITRELLRKLLMLEYVRRHEPHVPGNSRIKGPPRSTSSRSRVAALSPEQRVTQATSSCSSRRSATT